MFVEFILFPLDDFLMGGISAHVSFLVIFDNILLKTMIIDVKECMLYV